MSVTLLLIPAALAAVTAAGATGLGGVLSIAMGGDESAVEPEARDVPDVEERPAPATVVVRTRMKDAGLLAAALESIGATGIRAGAEQIDATVDDVELRLTRTPEEIWQIHAERSTGADLTVAEAGELVERLDSAYAAQVQQAVAARIRGRASEAGFELVSETRDEDDTVTMVLTVKDYA